jgi:8-oxo-dGTP pyrophosphatase MutT (NUDIX family)
MLNMTMLAAINQKIDQSIYADRCRTIVSSSNPYSRLASGGHITASGLVIKDGKVLLIFHPYIKQWFQPGGHIDEGESPVEAAIREVYEETGFVCVLDSSNSEPIDIDVHEIPANPQKSEGAHLHIDLLYRLKAVRAAESPEGILCNWFSFEQIDSPRIQRALANLSP